MRRREFSTGLGAIVGFGMLQPDRVSAQTAQAFQIGVFPNVSARIILTNYRPLREYLAEALGRPVEIATAPDLREFHKRTLDGAYDLVITAANLGRVAELDGKLRMLGGFGPPIPALVVTRKEAPMASIEALRGKALALANPQSLVALIGKRWLAGQGLVDETDYKTSWARNEDSLAQLLVSGEAPAAIMSMGEFRVLRDDIRQTLEFKEFARVPNFTLLAGPGASPADAARLGEKLFAFTSTDLGKEFAQLTGVQSIRPAPAEDLAALDEVAAQTRAALR